MTFANACVYSLLGMLVVFFALFLLMCMIKIMTALSDRAPARTASPAPTGESVSLSHPANVGATAAAAPGTAGELKLYGTDPRTAAMLMAIVADELGAPVNELRFLSIREVKENN